jgi:hypothetical protein
VGGGGICHLIADDIVDILTDNDIDAMTHSSDYEQHVTVIAWKEEISPNVYEIDIPYDQYETGGGFNWTKRKDVDFDEVSMTISQLPMSMEEFKENYLENEW